MFGSAIGGTLNDYILNYKMEKYDREMLNSTYEGGTPGQTSTWVNPDTGHQYQVTPQPVYKGLSDQYCRKAEIIASIDGKLEKISTTACRDMAGRWEIQ
jgi:surface antigen